MTRRDQHAQLAARLTAAAAGLAGLLLLAASLQIYNYTTNTEARFSADRQISCLTREACRTMSMASGAVAAIVVSRRVSRYPVSLPAAAALFILPAVLLHHAVPFARVWSFLLPVYLMLAAAGLCLALRPVVNLAGKPRQAAWAVLALALGAGLSIRAGSSKEIALSKETGNWRDARAVTLTLKERLRPGDRLLYHWLGSWALRYYFKQEGLPVEHLKSAPRDAGRVWVAVDQGPDGKSLAWLLQRSGLSEKEFKQPQAVRSYPETILYLLEWKQRAKAVSAR